MGFFDRFTTKKTKTPTAAPISPPPAETPSTSAAVPAPAHANANTAPAANASATAATVKPRLAAAREHLDARDLPAAMAIYEEVLGGPAGDRADVLVAISGDLGSHGHVAEIIELIAPRYAADRHGPATGINLIQAYLALRNADAAQHVLDILFALGRPELEERLHGFSNAIAELLATPEHTPILGAPGAATGADATKVGLITISKPIWFYGLEPLTAQILPPKEGRLRRIAFAQLALPGHAEKSALAASAPETDLGRLSRAIPLWLAETFYFSPSYAPLAAVGLVSGAPGEGQFATFPAEWTTENLRQLVDTHEGGLDYIVTGALRCIADDYDLVLRVWEVKAYRERKSFTARWAPSTADAALTQLHAQVRAYMEWSPASAAFAYTIPAQPRPWLDTLGASLGLFLVEKSLLAPGQLQPVGEDLLRVAQRAAAGEAAALAWLTLRARATKVGVPPPGAVTLARSPLVAQAQKAIG